MRYLLSFISLLLTSFLLGQDYNQHCDGVRYFTQVFPDEPTVSTVKYGENITISGTDKILNMTIFQPAGDDAEKRPVIFFAHGGYFLYGVRSDMFDIAKFYAKKGYVTASIDYRLYDYPLPPQGPYPDSLDMIEEVLYSVSDFKAAIRFFRKDAAGENKYRIDPDYIFIGGSSAGAIAALHTAFLDEGEAAPYMDSFIEANGGLEGNTDNPEDPGAGYSSDVQGVISYFGALHKKEWIDAEDPPFISIHGDADAVVPYGHGFAVVVIIPIITVDGSGELHPYADLVGVKNELITVPGGGHGNFTAEYYDQMNEQTALFLGEILCGDQTDIAETMTQNPVNTYPNPAADHIKLLFTQDPGAYHYQLLDPMGRQVMLGHVKGGTEQYLSIAHLPRGMYLLNLTFEKKNAEPVQRKIMIE